MAEELIISAWRKVEMAQAPFSAFRTAIQDCMRQAFIAGFEAGYNHGCSALAPGGDNCLKDFLTRR